MAPEAPISAAALGRATLARQGLLEPMSVAAAAAIERVGSLQAQHPEWPPVALATRSAGARTADLAGALDRREAVRSSLMRVTIHVVAASDFWPMFAVCQPMRIDQWRRLLKADPTDSPLGRAMHAAHDAARAALRERPRSSLELDRLMADEVGPAATAITRPAWRQPQSQIVVRAAWRHFAAFEPLVHVPHPDEGYGRSLYALAADWLGVERPELDLDAARVHVARRYFAAFGPATLDDLISYVGRGPGGVGVWRRAISTLADELVTLRDEEARTLHDRRDAPRPPADTSAPVRLLARWDSVLLSHAPKHRSRILDDEARAAVFTKNADVRPSFLVNGRVAGTWDIARGDGTASVALRPIRPLPSRVRDDLAAEAARVVALIGPGDGEPAISFSDA
jgi:hypothetical protein